VDINEIYFLYSVVRSCSPIEVMAVLISVLLSARPLGPGPVSFSARLLSRR
jgi:hypothetical protein